MGGLTGWFKQNTGVGQAVTRRQKQIDDATGSASPQPPQPPAAPMPDAGTTPAPAPKLDPNSEADQKYLEMKKKYGLKDGGVIDKTLLKRKAEVMKKRGC